MTVPGVGPVVALTFRATVDVPARFKNSKAVGAVFGMTPRRHQSGEIDRMGGISKCGDAMIRTMLFECGPGHADPHHQVVVARQMLEIVRHDEVCRRLMTTPGVGPVVALTFRATVDVPSRFASSKAVGAAFGLTPRRQQSGEIDRMGGISKCGDAMMREMLFEAALVLMTHSRKWSWLKAWGMKIARHRGMKRAIVAVARRLAVIMHRMWVDGTEFRWTREEAAAT